MPRTHNDIVQELLAKLAKVDGYEDTDSGETLTVGSQIHIKDSVVNGESAMDQVASGGGKCNRCDVTIDSDDNSSCPEMTSETQSVPEIIQVSLYGINRHIKSTM